MMSYFICCLFIISDKDKAWNVNVWHFWEYKESVAVVWHDRQNIEIAGK